MAIIEDRLSTTVVEDVYLNPDGRIRSLNNDFEIGPVAITDMSEGSRHQIWRLTFSAGEFILTPEDVGSPVVIISGRDSIYCSFAFDKNGRPSIFWKDSANLCYLYWYDSSVSMFITTDYFSVFHGMLSLDDKRVMQSAASDILLWYTKLVAGPQYNLYHSKQRDRYTVEHLMETDIAPYIYQTGMHEGLRGQIALGQLQVVSPELPPGPPVAQANLDFELGDVYWEKINDFTITQSDPYAGSWSAILDTIPANYSTLKNNVYTSITPEGLISVSCMVKGSIVTSIALGFKFYNSARSLVLIETASKSVSLIWAQITHSIFIPINAVYMKVFIESNATDGIVSLDNFTL